MRSTARVLAAAIAGLFLVFGVLYMFSPEGRMSASGLEATSDLGFVALLP